MMTTLVRRTAITLLTVSLASAPSLSAEVSGRILGDGAKPVPHAVVFVLAEPSVASGAKKPFRIETGDDGGFAAKALTGAGFRLRIVADGYAPMTQPGIPAGATVQLRLKRGAQLAGSVRDRAANTAIGGATIFAWDKDADAFGEDAFRKTTTGKDGRFVLPDLP